MGLRVVTSLFVLSILLGVVQLWFAPWGAELFIKIEMTVAAFLLVALVVWMASRESKEDQANRSGEHLDS